MKLRANVAVDGLKIPVPAADPKNGANLADGTYVFDLGLEDKSVVVKFLSFRDEWLWGGHTMPFTTFYLDFPRLATRVAEVFSQRETGAPVIIGLFFEPMVHRVHQFDLSGLTEAQKDFARAQIKAAENDEAQTARAIAREKLLRQVSHFAEYLRREGVLE